MDRIEVSSPLPDLDSWANNASLTAELTNYDTLGYVASPSDMATSLGWGNNYIFKVLGVNQQTGAVFEDTPSSGLIGTFGNDWDQGYYKLSPRIYHSTGLGQEYVDIAKRPIYWNKSPLRFMTYVAPGSFQMGSPSTEIGHNANEVLHNVSLTQGFYIQRTQCTSAMWNKVMSVQSAGDNKAKNNVRYSMFDPDGRVTWYQNSAQQYGYIDELPSDSTWSASTATIYDSVGKKTSSSTTMDADSTDYGTSFITTIRAINGLAVSGYVWELPTEAQWEYACRAGTKTAFNNGVNLTTSADVVQPQINDICVYKQNGNTVRVVASYKPNHLGLYDCHGNVFEWCRDWYTATLSDAVDPTGPSSGTYRLLRGGGCSYAASYCRSARRYNGAPGSSISYYGLRLALVLG